MNPETPYAILAELTHRCPLRCPYCYNPVDLVRRNRELDTDCWKNVLQQAAEMGVLQVHFSGGEPTARKDIEELVAFADDVGLYTNLITSGVLSDEQQLKRLAAAGLAHVQISIQDSIADNGDWVAGYPGAQQKKLALAECVDAAGLPLTINAMIHRQNIERVEEMIDLAVAMHAQRLEVANVQYYGWGLRNRHYLMPTLEQLKIMDRKVKEKIVELQGSIVVDYVVPDYYARRPKACMNGWGRRFINITPEGKVMPCHAAETIPDMQFDSVLETPLQKIWTDSEAFNRFRGTAWMPEPCRSCDQREVDWGGCRCQALALTGAAANPDPVCDRVPGHAEVLQTAIEDSRNIEVNFDYRNFSGGD